MSERFLRVCATAGYAILACIAGGRRTVAQAAADPRAATPTEWIEARGGIDNVGTIAGTLSVEWQFRAPHPVRAISVAQGIVLLGTESADARGAADGADQRGTLIALMPLTGKMLWTRSLPSWIHGDPAIFHGRAYVTFGRWPMMSPGGIVCVDLASGRSRWSCDFPSGVMPAPALDTLDGFVVVAGGDGVLSLLSLEDGRLQGEFGLKAPNAMSSPRVDPLGTVIFGAGSFVTSVMLSSQSLAWQDGFPLLHSLGDMPVALSDSVVFTTGTQTYGLRNASRALPLRRFSALVLEGLRTKKWSAYRTWMQQQWLLAVSRWDGHVLWRRPLG